MAVTTVKQVSLKDVRAQRKFETDEGVRVKCFLFEGQYLGSYTVRPNAEKARKRYKELESKWRREHNKSKEYRLAEDQKEPLITEAIAEHVGAFWDFRDDEDLVIPGKLEDGTLNKPALVSLLLADPVYIAPILALLNDEEAMNQERLAAQKGNS